MARVHLFEFEDQPWFPSVLREAMTDCMSYLGEMSRRPYLDFVKRLQPAMAACGAERLVDLCAGGGGPSWTISQMLTEATGKPVPVLLTDLYPNHQRWERLREISSGVADFVAQPVDATQVPASLPGFRLVCSGFHHLRPEQARLVLADAVKQRQGIAIWEGLERSWSCVLQLPLSFPFLFLIAPFVKPFRLSRLFFTYIVPLVPLCLLWDAFVSSLRVYSPAELRELVASLPESNYVWDIGPLQTPGSPRSATYLIGYPRP
jgi:hypothetical protein